MTRAKSRLHLIAPLRFYVGRQSRTGDAHVYGGRSRFISNSVLDCLEQRTWSDSIASIVEAPDESARVDIAGKLRGLWA
jgi:DNA helicase-2/ATP-dependent DNA helicase PcrA